MDVTSIIHLLEHYVITLLSPLIRNLNAMISLCEIFVKNFDNTFNCKKTVCIEFGQKLLVVKMCT